MYMYMEIITSTAHCYILLPQLHIIVYFGFVLSQTINFDQVYEKTY